MQEHVDVSHADINKDLLVGVLGMPKWWLPAVIFLSGFVATGLGAFGWMLNQGVGVTGLNRPVLWGFFIANFPLIFISIIGTLASARHATTSNGHCSQR